MSRKKWNGRVFPILNHSSSLITVEQAGKRNASEEEHEAAAWFSLLLHGISVKAQKFKLVTFSVANDNSEPSNHMLGEKQTTEGGGGGGGGGSQN